MRAPRLHARLTKTRLARRTEYADYMRSPAWWARRRLWWQHHTARTGTPTMCCPGGCGTTLTIDDDMHHRSYDRLGEEAHEDLIPLCRPCHDALHIMIEASPKWRQTDRALATDAALKQISYLNRMA